MRSTRGGARRLPLAGSGKLGGLGGRRAAGEALADVDRRAPGHERLALEQRHALRRPAGDDGARVEAVEGGPRHRRVHPAQDSELPRRRKVEVEGAERPAERGRGADEQVAHEAERRHRLPLELVVAPEPGQAQEHEGEHRVARGGGSVVEGLLPRDERLAVGRGEEEAAALRVAEQLDGEERQPPRLEEPARLAGGDVQLVQAVGDVRVVVEVAGALGLAAAPGAVQPAPVGAQRPEQEGRQPGRHLEPVGPPELPSRLGEGGEQQAVPGGDRLVVPARLRPPGARLEQPLPLLCGQLAAQDGAAVLERLQQLLPARPEGRLQLLRGPGIGQALDALGVRVLGRGEAAAGQRQLAQDVAQRLLDHGAVALLAGQQPGVEVGRDEERVVVEHLLEMRHEPALVHRVAVEAAAHEVVQAARRHLVERAPDGLERSAAEEELERRGGRELRRTPEAAPARVELGEERALRLGEQRRRERLAGGLRLRRPPQRGDEPLGLRGDVLPPLPVGVRHRLQHLPEGGQPVARLRREVRAAEERLPLRGEEDGERPARLAGEGGDRLQVHGVDVRPLLPIDLDADEELVHQGGRRLVGERLPLHHVTPVARRVADRDEQRPVLRPRPLERLRSPRVPVHRVVGVLEEVGARLVREAVHAPTLAGRFASVRTYAELEVGAVYRSRYGRTVLEADNVWFTLLTMNTNPIHFDAEYARTTSWERPLVDSTFTLALVTGLSVADVSEQGVNLGWREVRLPAPVFAGDTLRAETEVLAKRESRSRPGFGVVTVRTRGLNQRDETVIEFERSIMLAL